MTSRTDLAPAFRLLRTEAANRGVQDALVDLFAGDGTIYLVVGFFTYNGFRSFRDDIASFLERSTENALIVVVGPSSDQFSPRIAQELWAMDRGGQVFVYKYRRGLHAKLYLRDGPEPYVIMGSANLTQVAFRYNLELGIEITGSDQDDPDVRPFVEWVEALVACAQPMRSRDLLLPIQLWNSSVNWTNKARLLPRRHVAKRVVPIVLLLLITAILAGWI